MNYKLGGQGFMQFIGAVCSFFALIKGADGLMTDGMNVIQLILKYFK